MRKFFYLAMALSMNVAMFSCGEDEVSPTTPTEKDEVKTFSLDEHYKATSSEIVGTWYGSYDGSDTEQSKMDGVSGGVSTKIERKLVLNSNGTYTNELTGVMTKTGSNETEYVSFEAEKGNYSYNANTGIVTYVVAYDSLADYRTLVKTGYSKKHYFSADNLNSNDKGTYEEKAQFTLPNNGSRQWVAKDTYLHTFDANLPDMYFLMSKEQKK